MNVSLERKHNIATILAVSAFFLFQACYEPIEGCLDPLSTNFEFAADDECDDCCTYPSLVLDIDVYYDSILYDIDSSYIDASGDTFKIEQFGMLLSQIAFDRDEQIVSVSDSVSLNLVDGSSDSISNTVVVFSSSGNLTAASFRYYDGISDPSFSIGFPYSLSEIDTTLVDDDFSTYGNLFELSENGTEILTQSITISTSEQDTLQLNHGSLIPISFDYEPDFERGSSTTIALDLSLDKWLEGIQLSSMNNTEITSLLITNSENIFSIRE